MFCRRGRSEGGGIEGSLELVARRAGGEERARDAQEPPGSGNRNAPSRIFLSCRGLFVCLFGVFFLALLHVPVSPGLSEPVPPPQ